MTGPDARGRVLAAADAVLVRSGYSALTLEAVAREAGLSKGGLLYHFASKRALIQGLIQAAIDQFDTALVAAEGPGTPWLQAYVNATLTDTEPLRGFAGVMAAAAEDPELLAPFRQALDRWYRLALDNGGPQAALVLLALDGYWVHTHLKTLPATVSPEVLITALGALVAGGRP